MTQMRQLENWFVREEQALVEAEGEGFHAFLAEDEAYSLGPHWHDFDAHLYLLEGSVQLTDCATHEEFHCAVGSKMIIPRRCVHTETSSGMTYVLALSVDPAALTGEINRDPSELPSS